jgi:hypothetical protein
VKRVSAMPVQRACPPADAADAAKKSQVSAISDRHDTLFPRVDG